MESFFEVEGRMSIRWMNCCFEHEIDVDKWDLESRLIQGFDPVGEWIQTSASSKPHTIEYHFGRVRITAESMSSGDTVVIEDKLTAPYCSCCERHLYVGFLEEELAEILIRGFGLQRGHLGVYDAGDVRMTFEKVVDPASALAEYGQFLERVEGDVGKLSEEEYLDLYNEGTIYALLTNRDEFEDAEPNRHQREELARLDSLLREHSRLVTHNMHPYPEKPADRWWWHLHENLDETGAEEAEIARQRPCVRHRIWNIISKVEHLPKLLEGRKGMYKSWDEKDEWWRELDRKKWSEAMRDIEDLERRYLHREMYPSHREKYIELKKALKAARPLMERLGLRFPRISFE